LQGNVFGIIDVLPRAENDRVIAVRVTYLIDLHEFDAGCFERITGHFDHAFCSSQVWCLAIDASLHLIFEIILVPEGKVEAVLFEDTRNLSIDRCDVASPGNSG